MSAVIQPVSVAVARPAGVLLDTDSVNSVGATSIVSVPKAEIKIDIEQTKKHLQETISRLNDLMRDGGRGLNFSLDEKLGAPVVSVRNSETGEVIRQIPNEVVVRVAHSIEDLKGILYNEAF